MKLNGRWQGIVEIKRVNRWQGIVEDKKGKVMFRKGETLCVAGGQRGLAVVAVCQCQNKWIWFVLK